MLLTISLAFKLPSDFTRVPVLIGMLGCKSRLSGVPVVHTNVH